MPTLIGTFEQPAPVADLARRLRTRGYNDLEIYSPVPAPELDEALDEMNRSMQALRTLLERDSTREIPDELRDSILVLRELLERDSMQKVPDELEKTLAAARAQLQGDSVEIYQLGVTLKEVEAAARSLREFLNYLERNPESLIRGKSEPSP